MAVDDQIGGGYVELELDGKPCRLVPSLAACLEISKVGGGLSGADQRVRALHFETICAIIGAGLEINGEKLNPKQRQDLLPKAIYEAGVFAMMAKCIEFIAIVGNGGRAIPDLGDEGEEQAGPLA